MRLFIEQDLTAEQPVTLTDGRAHYLRNVMRARIGDPVLLFNGRDGEWSARIDTLGKGSATLSPINQTRPQTPEPGPVLLFAPIKRTPLDFMVQKAVELGVSVLQPVQTERTNASRVNLGRIRSNAIEAAEQCERLTVPEVRPLEKYSLILDNRPPGYYLLVCVERGSAEPIDDALHAKPRDSAWGILIGPEGGFTTAEIDLLRNLPYVIFVSLGPRILRAETAALAALTCWQAVLGDWRSGRPGHHEISTRTQLPDT